MPMVASRWGVGVGSTVPAWGVVALLAVWVPTRAAADAGQQVDWDLGGPTWEVEADECHDNHQFATRIRGHDDNVENDCNGLVIDECNVEDNRFAVLFTLACRYRVASGDISETNGDA